ncbi:hypothetical protein RF11_15906 [Thelohanellus kitauei]|uniref:C2H2-type domain-containing protein n=1 Tax=Thelohanellus kitauei TaxID=669202 RepID=A0A0C2MD55_THEKT|nr:hypothetical protein RF11_15906 [Thelohanellus kitauei]
MVVLNNDECVVIPNLEADPELKKEENTNELDLLFNNDRLAQVNIIPSNENINKAETSKVGEFKSEKVEVEKIRKKIRPQKTIPEKFFNCSIKGCGKAFSTSSGLKRHSNLFGILKLIQMKSLFTVLNAVSNVAFGTIS